MKKATSVKVSQKTPPLVINQGENLTPDRGEALKFLQEKACAKLRNARIKKNKADEATGCLIIERDKGSFEKISFSKLWIHSTPGPKATSFLEVWLPEPNLEGKKVLVYQLERGDLKL